MPDGPVTSVALQVRALVARFANAQVDDLSDDTPLAGKGASLGYDSVRLVELLLACEDELGRALPVDEVLAGPPLTLGRLIEWVSSSTASDR